MSKKLSARLVLASLFVFVIAARSSACINLGTYGSTWPIKEKDALVQIKNALKKKNWRKFFTKKRFLEAFHEYENRLSTNLPEAKRHVVYTVDMTYTLNYTIRDASGNVLYPKGYTFKPLDYFKVPFVYVIINGKSKKQVNWFIHSKYYNKIKSMLLICKGDVLTLEKKIKMPIFYADKRIIRKFDIKAVPSIAYQKGDKFYVEEIPVSGSGGDNAANSKSK